VTLADTRPGQRFLSWVDWRGIALGTEPMPATKRHMAMVRVAFLLLALLAAAGCATAPAPSGTISPTATGTGLSRDQAIAIARAAEPRRGGAAVLQADVGPFADLGNAYAASRVSPPPTPERLVWRVNLGTVSGPLQGDGTIVILDFQTGSVIQVYDWVS